jgi:hypothetical protein
MARTDTYSIHRMSKADIKEFIAATIELSDQMLLDTVIDQLYETNLLTPSFMHIILHLVRMKSQNIPWLYHVMKKAFDYKLKVQSELVEDVLEYLLKNQQLEASVELLSSIYVPNASKFKLLNFAANCAAKYIFYNTDDVTNWLIIFKIIGNQLDNRQLQSIMTSLIRTSTIDGHLQTSLLIYSKFSKLFYQDVEVLSLLISCYQSWMDDIYLQYETSSTTSTLTMTSPLTSTSTSTTSSMSIDTIQYKRIMTKVKSIHGQMDTLIGRMIQQQQEMSTSTSTTSVSSTPTPPSSNNSHTNIAVANVILRYFALRKHEESMLYYLITMSYYHYKIDAFGIYYVSKLLLLPVVVEEEEDDHESIISIQVIGCTLLVYHMLAYHQQPKVELLQYALLVPSNNHNHNKLFSSHRSIVPPNNNHHHQFQLIKRLYQQEWYYLIFGHLNKDKKTSTSTISKSLLFLQQQALSICPYTIFIQSLIPIITQYCTSSTWLECLSLAQVNYS